MNAKKNDVKFHTEINGVLLTPEAIDAIKSFQDMNNDLLDIYTSDLAELVCWVQMLFANELDGDDETIKAGLKHLANLITVRSKLKLLAKP